MKHQVRLDNDEKRISELEIIDEEIAYSTGLKQKTLKKKWETSYKGPRST